MLCISISLWSALFVAYLVCVCVSVYVNWHVIACWFEQHLSVSILLDVSSCLACMQSIWSGIKSQNKAQKHEASDELFQNSDLAVEQAVHLLRAATVEKMHKRREGRVFLSVIWSYWPGFSICFSVSRLPLLTFTWAAKCAMSFQQFSQYNGDQLKVYN